MFQLEKWTSFHYPFCCMYRSSKFCGGNAGQSHHAYCIYMACKLLWWNMKPIHWLLLTLQTSKLRWTSSPLIVICKQVCG
jgi:hypothetical protein